MSTRRRTMVPFGTVSHTLGGPRAPQARAQALLPKLQGMLEALDLDESTFFLAWELVSLEQGLGAQDAHTAMMMLLALIVSAQQGSTTLGLDRALGQVLVHMVSPELESTLGVSADQWHERIKALIGQEGLPTLVGAPDDYRPVVLAQGALHQHRMWHHEARLIEALDARGQCAPALELETKQRQELVAQVATVGAFRLSDAQRRAVAAGLEHPTTIVTGGPGTGKTSVVVSMVRAWVRGGIPAERIAIAAPTGRAAYRMAESIQAQLGALGGQEAAQFEALGNAQTLHRLLEIRRGGQVGYHEQRPLPAQVVVVDEASMIDMFTMNHLVRALGPRTHLVLLGDADQLPSVEAGAVLRDLIVGQVASVQTVELTHSHRMSQEKEGGGHILRVAACLRQGLIEPLIHDEGPLLVPQTPAQWDQRWDQQGGHQGSMWVNVVGDAEDGARTKQALAPWVGAWVTRHLGALGGGAQALAEKVWQGFDGTCFVGEQAYKDLSALFLGLGRSKLLALTRGGPTGTRALNDMVAQAWQGAVGAGFEAGACVMMTRNDYGREIFNGDQGMVLWVAQPDEEPPRQMAVFERAGVFVAFDLDHLKAHLEPSFAITVHKSQGSEYDHVALVLPVAPSPGLGREILYTAVTRSKQSATIVGGIESLSYGVSSRLERHTRLGAL